MNRKILIWGWLRLFLSLVQTTCTLTAALLLLLIRFHTATFVFAGVATGATILSRLLYRGKTGPIDDSHRFRS